MKQSYFAGTGKLIRLFLRRDRFILPVWILLPVMLVAGQVSFVGAMADWQKFLGELSGNPLTSALLGPIVPLSREGAVLWRGMLQSAIAIMIGSAFTVIRHTRTEEESGRSELILGCAVGRHAYLTAALVFSCMGSLIAGLLVSALLIGSGFSAVGSLLAGLTIAASGWLFAGIGGLGAQLREHAGSARGFVFSVYMATFVLMVMNHVGGGSTGWAWLVPQSWFRITLPFRDNNLWPLLIFAILSLVPVISAYSLSARRDLRAGLFEQKPGAAEGSPGLNSPLALAWRQHKSTVWGWTIGMIFLGGSFGFITPNISDNISEMLVGMNSWAAAMARQGNREGFMAASIYMTGLMVGMSVYGIITVLKLKKEETEHFAEMVLARPVSRAKWMSSYLVMAFAGSSFILFMLGVGAGLGWSIASGDMTLLFRTLGMSLSKIPSAWIIIGIAALLYGWLPQVASILSWTFIGLFIIVEMLWEAGVVGWSAMKLTPFAYAHYSIPVNELPLFPLLGLLILATVLTGVGLIGFKRRSIG
ncbi:MAG TPA: hypothetical protein VEG39_14620 [Clostridia bacterium]|nr:hypothetical protein [Clostridia bacterium]